MINIQIKDDKNFLTKLKALPSKNLSLMESAIKVYANKTYEVAVEWTPLDRWREIYQYPELAPHEPGDMKKHWRKPTTTRYGNTLTSTIINDAEYAAAVNYGHRAIPGQYIPALPGHVRTNFVTGLFITDGVENMMSTTYSNVFDQEYAKHLERYFNG